MKGLYTIVLLLFSNLFMTMAWYGHLRFADLKGFSKLGLFSIIVISWGIAFFEYCFQIPANRIGYRGYGGPFTVWQLKVIQETITLLVFTGFSLLVFRSEPFRLNHAIGFLLLVGAVYFIFRK